MDRPLLSPDPLSVAPVVAGGCLGRTPSASNPLVSLLMESFEGSNGDICSGHAADVEDVDRKLTEGLSGPCGNR